MYIKLSAKVTRDYGAKETRSRQFIRRQLINKNGATCALCGKSIETMKDCTIDHIVPISKGGLTTIENCQLAHKKSIKENEADWLKYLGIKEN